MKIFLITTLIFLSTPVFAKDYIKQIGSDTYVKNTDGYEDNLGKHPAVLCRINGNPVFQIVQDVDFTDIQFINFIPDGCDNAADLN